MSETTRDRMMAAMMAGELVRVGEYTLAPAESVEAMPFADLCGFYYTPNATADGFVIGATRLVSAIENLSETGLDEPAHRLVLDDRVAQEGPIHQNHLRAMMILLYRQREGC